MTDDKPTGVAFMIPVDLWPDVMLKVEAALDMMRRRSRRDGRVAGEEEGDRWWSVGSQIS